ncbi:MAG: hypothetical protein WAU00_14730 [Caldilinea sp.]|uniref:hypothetical protein n=1 Tax=Caldilinea sp. TaxID=2293560 RepID=UPI002C47D8B3|nr:hypothetical protein [Anaerolineales bacterium]HQY94005.1 hypothetical protein [Caldilinea sp.]HRA66972.1 hypothetical protein [Caldilinea sp.]
MQASDIAPDACIFCYRLLSQTIVMDGEGEMKSEGETKAAATERAARGAPSDSPARWHDAHLAAEDETGGLSRPREKAETQPGVDAPFTWLDDEAPDGEDSSGAWRGEGLETRSSGVYLLIA